MENTTRQSLIIKVRIEVGKWKFQTDVPSYLTVLEYSKKIKLVTKKSLTQKLPIFLANGRRLLGRQVLKHLHTKYKDSNDVLHLMIRL
ncbi:hypothetical protein CDAR_400651 [Caerostris darwini]|uniref:Ubiquitin-like domain-containing protein n=1 Tax=Caerostris darwini TaxID=1538125 RepID=A0AAV4N9D8_9ARAC|nr:hypothetical protein CDAR_400651 [Caerostris darwini]